MAAVVARAGHDRGNQRGKNFFDPDRNVTVNHSSAVSRIYTESFLGMREKLAVPWSLLNTPPLIFYIYYYTFKSLSLSLFLFPKSIHFYRVLSVFFSKEYIYIMTIVTAAYYIVCVRILHHEQPISEENPFWRH